MSCDEQTPRASWSPLKKTEGFRMSVIYQVAFFFFSREERCTAGVHRNINRNHFLFLQWMSLGQEKGPLNAIKANRNVPDLSSPHGEIYFPPTHKVTER